MLGDSFIIYMLFAILLLILLLPVVSRRIERNLEILFLIMSILASIISGSFGYQTFSEALIAPLFIHEIPIGIFQIVLIAGIIFTKYMPDIEKIMKNLEKRFGMPFIFALLIFLMGIGSGIISAIVASLIIAEVSRVFPIERKIKNFALVISAFSIGFGASLTPLGEPLSTILVLKLSGPPYYADFFFPFKILALYILPLIFVLSIISYYFLKRAGSYKVEEYLKRPTYRDSLIRALKIYIFVFSLTLLGSSFTVIVEKYIIGLSPTLMYLFGASSSFLDNATVAAAIISPQMSVFQIKSFLISLLISGGFLIPGNVPNIVIAHTHNISFKEWAKLALPIGIPILIAMFFMVTI